MKYLRTLFILYRKAFQLRFSKNKGHHYQKFLIIGFARSGTTLLHTYLNSHPHIHSLGQVRLQQLAQPEMLFPPYSPGIKAGGAKFLLALQKNKAEFEMLKDFLEKEPSIKVIFLKRQNLLSLYVSYQIARNTQQWSQDGRQQKLNFQDKQLRLDLKSLQQFFRQAEEQLQQYDGLLKNKAVLEISYEALSEKPADVLALVQKFLEIKELPLFSLLQKQNPEPLAKLILNYPEITAALKGTPYKHFLR